MEACITSDEITVCLNDSPPVVANNAQVNLVEGDYSGIDRAVDEHRFTDLQPARPNNLTRPAADWKVT